MALKDDIVILAYDTIPEKYYKYKGVYDACTDAGIDVPVEVEEFFDYMGPDTDGIPVDLDDISGAIDYFEDHTGDGFRLNITKLPEHAVLLKIVRFA